tara:strand:- start:1822 stop:2082 length:261 start_codon:yes stop_codon:yes gene_type:complete
MNNNIKDKETEPCKVCKGKTECSVGETDIRLRPGDMGGGRVLCEKCFIKNIVMSYTRGNMLDEEKHMLIKEHHNRREMREGNRQVR